MRRRRLVIIGAAALAAAGAAAVAYAVSGASQPTPRTRSAAPLTEPGSGDFANAFSHVGPGGTATIAGIELTDRTGPRTYRTAFAEPTAVCPGDTGMDPTCRAALAAARLRRS